MEFADLQNEYESEGIGPRLLAEIGAISWQVASGYDPKTYGQSERWEDAIDDLVQDVVVGALLGEHQLDYVMAVAGDIEHFRRLVNKQVRRVLARRRTRTVVDNLLSRAKAIAGDAPFIRVDVRGKWRFHLAGDDPGVVPVSDEEIYDMAREIALVPTVPHNSGDRAPIVYTTENLKSVLSAIESRIPGSVEVATVDRILKKVLTPFLPSVLEHGEGSAGPPSRELGPEEAALVSMTISQILGETEQLQRRVLRMKLAGVSDTEVAAMLGVSRPTAANRKQEVTAVLLQAIEGMDEFSQIAVLDGVAIALVREDAQRVR